MKTSIHDKWVFTWRESRKKPAPAPVIVDVLGKSISILNLSTRSFNALMRAKIDTVEKLISEWGRIITLKGIGKTSIKDIRAKLTSYLTENKCEIELLRLK